MADLKCEVTSYFNALALSYTWLLRAEIRRYHHLMTHPLSYLLCGPALIWTNRLRGSGPQTPKGRGTTIPDLS
jgi:hypothetical protein